MTSEAPGAWLVFAWNHPVLEGDGDGELKALAGSAVRPLSGLRVKRRGEKVVDRSAPHDADTVREGERRSLPRWDAPFLAGGGRRWTRSAGTEKVGEVGEVGSGGQWWTWWTWWTWSICHGGSFPLHRTGRPRARRNRQIREATRPPHPGGSN
jgi:hypothetical protein